MAELNGGDEPGGRWVAGADGFNGGWFVVLKRPSDGEIRRRRVSSLAELVDAPEAPLYIGIDMVVGLPDRAERGGRTCDQMARSLLGYPRSSSVFSPPAYAALNAETYDEARTLHTGTADDAPGITIQAFHLLPKMREVDRLVTPERQDQIREVHPELAFYAMNGDMSVDASKHKPDGRQIRIDLLAAHGFADMDAVLDRHTGRGVGVDDVLDAHAACWSAERMLNGHAERLPPEDVPVNGRGRRMTIWR